MYDPKFARRARQKRLMTLDIRRECLYYEMNKDSFPTWTYTLENAPEPPIKSQSAYYDLDKAVKELLERHRAYNRWYENWCKNMRECQNNY